MNKKLWGAIVSASVFILYFGSLFLIFTLDGITTKDLPLPLFFIILLFLAIPLIGIILALIFRIKEINSGEEEDAKKY